MQRNLTAEAVRLRHRSRLRGIDRMLALAMQIDCKLLPDGFPFESDSSLEQIFLNPLRQVFPTSGNSVSQRSGQFVFRMFLCFTVALSSIKMCEGFNKCLVFGSRPMLGKERLNANFGRSSSRCMIWLVRNHKLS